MIDLQPDQPLQPTVLGAVWRYRWLVLFIAIAFAGLGWLYGTRSEQYSARGVIAVQDPRTSNLFDQAAGSPDRYVEDQAEILRSRVVAREAVDLLAQQDPPIDTTVDAVTSVSVSPSADANTITISYTAEDPREAIAVVNALAASYQDVSRQTAEATFTTALEELASTMDDIRAHLLDLQRQIGDLRLGDETTQALVTALVDARSQLVALEYPSPNASVEVVELAATRISELQTRIATLEAAINQTTNNPQLAELLEDQTEARRRLSELQTRHDQISVDADLAGSGVVFYDAAETASPSSVGLWVVLGGLFGAVVGSGFAFLLAQRRRRFAGRTEPERVLGAPLLTDIPHFSQERLRTSLPVTDSPASASAEAFRFVATGITVQQLDRSGNGAAVFKSVVITSAGLYDGKTTVTANTALAAAREGSKVLVVDADFGSMALTRELLGNVQPPMGMTDVAAGTVGLGEAVIRVTKEYAGTVSLLTRGTADIHAPDFFASQQAAKLFEAAVRDYDLVIIDAPPLLRVAYTTTIARMADRVILVVAHGSDLSLAEEMRHRLTMIGTPTLGYVYNQAPLRTEMTLSGGSMAYTVAPQAPTRR